MRPVDPRLLRHSRSSRTGVLLLTLLGLGQALATITIIVALSRIVVTRLGSDLGLLAVGFAGRALLTWAEQVVAQRTAARVAQELRAAVLATALDRGPAWVAGFGTGRLAALLTGGMDALRPWFAGYLPALTLAVLLPPLVVVVMALVDPASALIAVLTLPLIPVFGVLVGRATERRAQERWAASARLSGHFLDVVRGLAALRLYGRADRQVAVVRQMTERHRAATVRVLRIAFLSSTALDLVATLSVGLIAVEAGLRVAAGRLDLGPALLVILLAPEAYRPLREVGARFHAGADAGAVITEVDEVLAAPLPGPAPRSSAPLSSTRESAFGSAVPSIVVSGVQVRHPQARVDALDLPALRLRAGEFVALRGPSGAGKTTALRVLAGLQPAVVGSVEVTGPRPLYLPQRPTLPHARTVAEALLRDDELDQPMDDETLDHLVRSALAVVGLATEVAAMPEGFRTPLGEHGQGLSSGQRQRLALARLLRAARERPSVLLLDEPTAHLDETAEQLVIAELRAAARRGCAVLVVAHRPALLAAADRAVHIKRTVDVNRTADIVPASPLVLAPPPRHPAQAQGERSVGLKPTDPSRSLTSRALRQPVAAVGLGAAAWLAGVTLTGAAAWLLVRASTLPPVLTLSAAVVTVRASAVARPLLRYLERLASHEVGFARLGQWRASVYADLIPRMPGAGLRRRGELLSRIVEDVDLRVDGLLRGWLPAASAALALGVAVAAAVLLFPTTAPALIAALVIAAVIAPAWAARQAGRQEDSTARARAELADAVVETVEGIDELAGRGMEAALRIPLQRGRTLAQIEARAARSAGAAAAIAHLGLAVGVIGTAAAVTSVAVTSAAVTSAAVTSVAVTSVAVTSAAGTGRGTGRIGAELAAVLLLGVVTLAEPLLALPDAAIARHRAARARARLAALRDLPRSAAQSPAPPPVLSPAQTPVQPDPSDPSIETITVRDLVAGWDPARTPALNGLDLDLPAGSRAAVLGPSGSGKSTLAAILTRLLDPVSGAPAWNGRVAMVGDDVDHVFASTVRENLRLSRSDASDDELRAVLTEVRLTDWLSGLPHGLDTWLGEGGTTMSGGERRRLVTARALLSDPDLLILDEPTEGLDEPTAHALMADLLAVTAGRRVLLLTHRSEGLDQVDAIHELVAGRLFHLSAVG